MRNPFSVAAMGDGTYQLVAAGYVYGLCLSCEEDAQRWCAALNEAYADGYKGDKEAEKAYRFIDHIQAHLAPGEEVVCKICGRTARKICEEGGE